MTKATQDESSEGRSAAGEVVEVQLNGRATPVPPDLTVHALLEHLELAPEMIVVEHNFEILDRAAYRSVPVASGDRIELVHFVGGG